MTDDVALFDLERPAELGKTDRELHEGLGPAARGWARAGYCADTRWDWHPNPETGWYGAHVCTQRAGHGGRHECDRCGREWRP